MLGSQYLSWLLLIFILSEIAFATDCEWEMHSGKLVSSLEKNNIPVSRNHTFDSCQIRCEEAKFFVCTAFNFKDNKCVILPDNQVSVKAEEESGWKYYKRPLCLGIWLPWTAGLGRYIEQGAAVVYHSESSLSRCMVECLRISGAKSCNSISIHGPEGNCTFQSSRADSNPASIIPSENWTYFNRPSWYQETSGGASTGEIKDLGEIGYLQHIFTEVKIPVSGYLVGWQFYTKFESLCTTYANIMRNTGENSYQLISRTPLIKENNEEDVSSFQFITDDLIRVERNDVLALQTKSGAQETGCINSLVSVNPSEGGRTIKSPHYNEIRINETFNYEDGVDGTVFVNAQPALKAYVSAYLSLEEPPTLHHDQTLDVGQILLRPATLPDSDAKVVIIGYKVTCSTSADMTETVACYEGLVPTESDPIVLQLEDFTRPYYVGLQAVRRYRELNLPEGRLSVSSLFCTARSRTDQVDINETSAGTASNKRAVTVTFRHIFHEDDSCAKAIHLSTSGYDSGYRAIDADLDRMFPLLLKPATTYALMIYLKLADDYEFTFWSRNVSYKATTESSSACLTSSNQVIFCALLAVLAAKIGVIPEGIQLAFAGVLMYANAGVQFSTVTRYLLDEKVAADNFTLFNSKQKLDYVPTLSSTAQIEYQRDARKRNFGQIQPEID